MCQTGGPRCYAEAKRSADAAEAQVRAAQGTCRRRYAELDRSAGRESAPAAAEARRHLTEAFDRYFDALADLAATDRGAQEVAVLTQTQPGIPLVSPVDVEDLLEEGKWRRERGRLVRAIRAAGDNIPSVVGVTGDPEVDALVSQAARNLAADPKGHRNPTPGGAKVPHYATESDKTRDVHQRIAFITQAAEQYRQNLTRLDQATEEVHLLEQSAGQSDADEHTHRRLVTARRVLTIVHGLVPSSETNLVLMAETLRTAQAAPVAANA